MRFISKSEYVENNEFIHTYKVCEEVYVKHVIDDEYINTYCCKVRPSLKKVYDKMYEEE